MFFKNIKMSDFKSEMQNVVEKGNYSLRFQKYISFIFAKYFVKSFECLDCEKRFKTQHGLDHHYLVMHSTKCLNCQRDYGTIVALNQHLHTKIH